MTRKWRSIWVTTLFLATIPLWIVLAWNGDHFSLIALGVTAAFLALMSGYLSYHWGETLDSWRSTLNRWDATTKYSLEQDRIMHDALADLADHDAEAAHIHTGRMHSAVTTYAENFGKESDAKATAEHGAPW